MTWYIVDAAWLSSWLYFTHYDKFVSPCPGPCRNDDLITYSFTLERWIPKPNLILSTKDKPGHYCKVNKEVWNLFYECYDHSGPAIYINNHPPLPSHPPPLSRHISSASSSHQNPSQVIHFFTSFFFFS